MGWLGSTHLSSTQLTGDGHSLNTIDNTIPLIGSEAGLVCSVLTFSANNWVSQLLLGHFPLLKEQ